MNANTETTRINGNDSCTRDVVMQSAMKALSIDSEATMSEIGMYLGRAKSIVHYHFQSKADMILQTYRHYRKEFRMPLFSEVGFELSALTLMRRDPALRRAVAEAWKAERKALTNVVGESQIAMLYQAVAIGLKLAQLADPDVTSEADEALLVFKRLLAVE